MFELGEKVLVDGKVGEITGIQKGKSSTSYNVKFLDGSGGESYVVAENHIRKMN